VNIISKLILCFLSNL